MPQLEEEDKKPEVVIEELQHLRGDHHYHHQRQIKKVQNKTNHHPHHPQDQKVILIIPVVI